MNEPRVRVRGKINVIAEYVCRRFELLKLDQEAVRAHMGMQRIKRLHAMGVPGLDERVGQRRHAQITERAG
jgi:hypothetical protein